MLVFTVPIGLAIVAAFRQCIEVSPTEVTLHRTFRFRHLALPQGHLEWRWDSDGRLGFLGYVVPSLGGRLSIVARDGTALSIPMTDFGGSGPKGRTLEIANAIADLANLSIIDRRDRRAL